MDAPEYTSHRVELAARIRALREKRGHSTRGFAMMVGISRTYLLRVENAKASPTFDMLERISAGLDIAPHVLVDFEYDSSGATPESRPTPGDSLTA